MACTTAEELAVADVCNGASLPRGASKFFNVVTNACSLCGVRLGKGVVDQARDAREAHEQSDIHKRSYVLYKTHFATCVEIEQAHQPAWLKAQLLDLLQEPEACAPAAPHVCEKPLYSDC